MKAYDGPHYLYTPVLTFLCEFLPWVWARPCIASYKQNIASVMECHCPNMLYDTLTSILLGLLFWLWWNKHLCRELPWTEAPLSRNQKQPSAYHSQQQTEDFYPKTDKELSSVSNHVNLEVHLSPFEPWGETTALVHTFLASLWILEAENTAKECLNLWLTETIRQ